MNKIYSHKIFIQTFELENTQNTGITVIGIIMMGSPIR